MRGEVRMLPSMIEGEVRCTDGTLVVFVRPAVAPCDSHDAHRVHGWMHADGVVRECAGVKA